MKTLWRLIDDCRGATAIEYGLLVALLAIAGLGVLVTINTQFGSMWSGLAGRIPSLSG
ncbi:Flp family type IVb pilin [uncultured Sphingomonas sp.]|uniref:Flp family type IVb pilin n=1 Tax=uncultured Sphingomonas sp. TaxID=158754 RepID=UPI00344E6237